MGYKIIRPRRGIKSLWDAYKDKIYKTGEMLVESPESGVGTGPVNVKFGDGMTPYYALPYAIEAPINQAIEGSTKPITSGAVYEQNKNLGGLRFGVDGDGNYGYLGADDSLIPFRRFPDLKFIGFMNADATSKSFTIPEDTDIILQLGVYAATDYNRQTNHLGAYDLFRVYKNVGETHTTTQTTKISSSDIIQNVTVTGHWESKTKFNVTRSSTTGVTSFLLFKYS